MFLITELVIIGITGILLVHAIQEKSPEFALYFWLGGAWFGFIRELLVANYSHLYMYGGFTIWLFKVPVIFLVFWTNFTYVAFVWSENALNETVMKNGRSPGPNFYPLMFLILVVLGIMVEAFGSQFQMIYWQIDSPYTLWGGVPVVIPFSYGLMGILYLAGFREIWTTIQDPVKRAYHLTAWAPLLVLVHLGALFLVKIATDIFSGQLKLH
ncbi:MAG: hypothetical protein K9N11_10000 [Lentisphaeria bacterium]|nr:hypothetical protein [Candidatus Neomarinimicrobiota bacterium]MCF7843164.1 hypothetical protein [Lentisphaeria bacterium]